MKYLMGGREWSEEASQVFGLGTLDVGSDERNECTDESFGEEKVGSCETIAKLDEVEERGFRTE